MKTIYLWIDGTGWSPFKYTDLSELDDEFEKRSIIIGEDCNIGDECTLSNGCELGSECELGYKCRLGSYCKFGDGCTLCNMCKIGKGCELGEGCYIGNSCKIGNYCKLGNWCEIGHECNFGNECNLDTMCKIVDRCNIPKTLVINASRHTVSYWGEDFIQIGCKCFSILEWQNHFQKIGEYEEYTPEQIEEYKMYIDMIANIHKIWNINCVSKN